MHPGRLWEAGVATPAWAAEVEAAVRTSPHVGRKWQTIQSAIGDMPPGAMAELMVQLTRALADSSGRPVVTQTVVDVIDEWYHRALFVRANRDDPVEPVFTVGDWNQLPDREL
jgi:hypothetical protein